MRLTCSGRETHTVFDLLGDKENDMTFSLGWVLSRSEKFLAGVLEHVTGRAVRHVSGAEIRLQEGRAEHGRTDVEIHVGSECLVILEAKRGPALPGERQLKKYAAVLRPQAARQKVLVAVTNATLLGAARAMSGLRLDGIELRHVSWRDVKVIAERARGRESHANKRWLTGFIDYLEGLLNMQERFSNRTYVVSLATGNPEGWKISWIDIVTKRGRYFYPVGGGWPDPPPNYIAFRYSGRLQSIHHVRDHEVITDPRQVFPEAAADRWKPHYCLKLGPAMIPPRVVKAGPRVRRAARVYCMLDTLFTSATISDALTESKRRESAP